MRDLIRIDSQNPGSDERRIAYFVKGHLDKLGFVTKIYEFKGRRSNVIGILRSQKPAKSLLITPHLDTVPYGKKWKVNPFAGSIKNGRIYGLGATDCKGNLACALEAISSIVEENVKLEYNLVFAATADEECGSSLGLLPLLNKGLLRSDAAVILDSDDFGIVVAQKGLLHLKIKIEGRRAHGAYPWRGINAIDLCLQVISGIKKHKFSYKKIKYLRPPTVNVGTINGGDKVNIVADWCEFELDVRFYPGMCSERVVNDIKKIIGSVCPKYIFQIEALQQPFQISTKHSLVNHLKSAMLKSGIKPEFVGSEGATVITFLHEKGIPVIATGFGVSGCEHTSDEYVTINNLLKGSLVMEYFLKDFKFNQR